MDTFLIFNINPALVISLFPADTIAGQLHTPRSKWMELFGAVDGARLEPEHSVTAGETSAKGVLSKVTQAAVGRQGSVDTLRATSKDEDTISTSSSDKVTPVTLLDESESLRAYSADRLAVAPRAALEALMYFLSDRRQKLTGAIASHPLPAESSLPPLSQLSPEELRSLPSKPMTQYEPEQLLQIAQLIYTALIKVYLVARPVLVGSLCRIENWCDVEEVEGLLKEKQVSCCRGRR